MANYTFTAQSTDGEREFSGQLPEFALDSTLESILTALVGDSKQSKKSSDKAEKSMDELLDVSKKAIDGDKKNLKEFNEILEEGLKKSNREGQARDDKAIGSYNARLAASEKALRSVSGGIQKLGLGAITLASTLAVGFLNAITSAGESLNELRENGVAGTLDEARERIRSFQQLGVSRMYFQVLDEDDLDQVSLLAELLGEFSGTGTDD